MIEIFFKSKDKNAYLILYFIILVDRIFERIEDKQIENKIKNNKV